MKIRTGRQISCFITSFQALCTDSAKKIVQHGSNISHSTRTANQNYP